MASSDRRWLGLLAHELAGPVARMGSEAELMAVEAVRELHRAYGPGPEYEAAEARILARRDGMREARSVVASFLRLAPLLVESTDAVNLSFAPTSLVTVISGAVEAYSNLTQSQLRISIPDDGIEVTCDAGLMEVCLGCVLKCAVRDMKSGGRIEIQVAREAGEAVISVLTSVSAERSPALLNGWLPETIAKAILDLHEGRLEEGDGNPRVIQLRLPLGLTPGRRLVSPRRRD